MHLYFHGSLLLYIHRGCSSLFSVMRGIQKLDLSDTVVRDDAMQAVAQLSNLNTLNLAYSGTPAPPPALIHPPPPPPPPDPSRSGIWCEFGS